MMRNKFEESWILAAVLATAVGCGESGGGGGESGTESGGTDSAGDTEGVSAGDSDSDGGIDPDHRHYDDNCLVDGDCNANRYCALGKCVDGCTEDDACQSGEICDPHGRCVPEGEEAEPPPPAPIGGVGLSAERTTLEDPSGTVSVVVQNTSNVPARYRVEANLEGVQYDPNVYWLDPGAEETIDVTIDTASLGVDIGEVHVQVYTDGGPLEWIVAIPPEQSGLYTGRVSFFEDVNLGLSSLGLNLDFRNDGTVSGELRAETSFLWPHDLPVRGSWSPSEGTVELRFVDVIAENAGTGTEAMKSPLAREIGREITLTGSFDASGRILEGDVAQRLSGVVGEILEVPGRFRLEYAESLLPMIATEDFGDEVPLPLPESFPAALDEGACDGLGVDYGTTETNLKSSTWSDVIADCQACSTKPYSCTPPEAWGCAFALTETASGLDALVPRNESSQISWPDPDEWKACADGDPVYGDDGTTCHDTAALACAGSLVRYAIDTNTNEASRAALVEQWLGQLQAETIGGALLGTEKLIQAAFAYQQSLTGNALDRELLLLDQAAQGLRSPLLAVNSFGYLNALETLGRSVIVEDRSANDLRRALTLTTRYSEVFAVRARVRQRSNPAGMDAAQESKNARYLALWSHVLGVLWSHEFELFRAEDTFDEISVFGENVAALASVADELGPDVNAFGYPEGYVPLMLSPAQASMGVPNFEVVRQSSTPFVDAYETRAVAAQTAEETFWSQAYDAEARRQDVLSSYNERLGTLCGYDAQGEPALDSCGQQTGVIAELLLQMQAAQINAQLAVIVLNNARKAIDLEETALKEHILNFEATQSMIDEQNDTVWQIKDRAGKQRSAARKAEADEECGRIAESAMADAMLLAGQCTVDAGIAKIGAGVVAAGCVLKGAALAKDAGLQCKAAREQAGFENEFDSINDREEEALIAVNQEVDRILRESAIKDLIIDSEKVIAMRRNELAEHSTFVGLQQTNFQAALVRWRTALAEVAALVARRDRALAFLGENPNDPGTNPKFLQVRLDLGEDLLAFREHAAREAYLIHRALEYEINRDANMVLQDLRQARSPVEMQDFLLCLDQVYADYQRSVGIPQQHVTEISLRNDVLGMSKETKDDVTGEMIPPDERFKAVLRDAVNRRRDGTVELTMEFSLLDDTLFSTLLCDDRIESIQAQVIGDFLGDGEIDVLITREGTSTLRRCDAAGLSVSDSLSRYVLSDEARSVLVTAGANDYGDANPNAGFAAWPVAGEIWKVAIPPPSQSPANADLDVGNISDIVLRINHRANTVGQSGAETFAPSCL